MSSKNYLKDNQDQQSKKNLFKMQEDESSMMIQTQKIAIQAIFTQPVLKLLQYLQQHQKYNFRAALSGINLKVDEFDNYYSSTKKKVEQGYDKLACKSVKIIFDLLISLKVARIQIWRQNAMAATLLKNNLFKKTICPYDFQSKQFQSDANQLIQAITKKKDNQALFSSKLIELSKRIKDKETQKMQQMFCGKVIWPYLAQNIHNYEVNPSQMYSSLIKQINMKNHDIHENTLLNISDIQDIVMKYTQILFQNTLKTQKSCIQLIKRYNQEFSNLKHCKDSISPPISMTLQKKLGNYKFIEGTQQDVLHSGRQKWSQVKQAWANKPNKLQYKGYNRLVNSQTSRQDIVSRINLKANVNLTALKQLKQSEKQILTFGYNKYSSQHNPFKYFAILKQIDENYFQKGQIEQDEMKTNYQKAQQQNHKDRNRQKPKFKQDQINRYEYEDKSPRITNTRSKNKKKVKHEQTKTFEIYHYQHQFPFLNQYLQRINRQNALFQQAKITKKNDQIIKNNLLYKNQVKRQQSLIQEQDQQDQSRQNQIKKYEMNKKQEEKLRKNRFKHIWLKRSYQNFMKMSKIQIRQQMVSRNEIQRYGLRIQRNLSQQNHKDFDKFLYYYFKERYYRQNDSIQQNNDNPIIFLDSSKVNMEANQKIVSQLIGSTVKRISSLPFFIIWSEDIMIYRLHLTKQDKYGQITIYPLKNIVNMQRLIYEIRRRINFTIKETIKYNFYFENDKTSLSQSQLIACKTQIVHRSIHQRHLQYEFIRGSVKKGQQIIKQIFSEFQ